MNPDSVFAGLGSPPLFAFVGSTLCLGAGVLVARRSPGDSAADRYFVVFLAVLTSAVVLLLGCLLTPVSHAFRAMEPWAAGRAVTVSRPLPWLWTMVVGAGMAWVVLRRLGGTLVVNRIVMQSDRPPASLRDVLYSCCEDLRVTQPVLLRVSDDTPGPFVTGVFSPVIVVPRELLDRDRSAQAHVLRHELAHLSRKDTLTQMLSQIAGMLLWWNPLYWIAAREMNLLRELACDDAATFGRVDRSDYTSLLRYYAGSTRWADALGFSQIRMAAAATLDRRLAVLEINRPLSTTLLGFLPNHASRIDVAVICVVYAIVFGGGDLFVFSLDYDESAVFETTFFD